MKNDVIRTIPVLDLHLEGTRVIYWLSAMTSEETCKYTLRGVEARHMQPISTYVGKPGLAVLSWGDKWFQVVELRQMAKKGGKRGKK